MKHIQRWTYFTLRYFFVLNSDLDLAKHIFKPHPYQLLGINLTLQQYTTQILALYLTFNHYNFSSLIPWLEGELGY